MWRFIKPISKLQNRLPIIKNSLLLDVRNGVMVIIKFGLYSCAMDSILIAPVLSIILLSNRSFMYLALLGHPVKNDINRTYAASFGTLNIFLNIKPMLSLIILMLLVDKARSLKIKSGKIEGNRHVFHRLIP